MWWESKIVKEVEEGIVISVPREPRMRKIENKWEREEEKYRDRHRENKKESESERNVWSQKIIEDKKETENMKNMSAKPITKHKDKRKEKENETKKIIREEASSRNKTEQRKVSENNIERFRKREEENTPKNINGKYNTVNKPEDGKEIVNEGPFAEYVKQADRIGGKLYVLGVDQRMKEVELWEVAGKYGTIWEIHVHRNEGRSRGTATIIFDKWIEAERFRKEQNGTIAYGKILTVRWDRELTGIQGENGKPGEYPMDMTEKERRTIVIGGIEEGGENEEERRLVIQNEVVRRAMDSKNLRTWQQVRWKVESTRRIGRQIDGRPRLLSVCFASMEGADKVYHSRRTGWKEKVWVRRYTARKMKEMDDMLKRIRKKRWELRQAGIRWKEPKKTSRIKKRETGSERPQIQKRKESQLQQTPQNPTDNRQVAQTNDLKSTTSVPRTPLNIPLTGTPIDTELPKPPMPPPPPLSLGNNNPVQQQQQQEHQELGQQQQEQQHQGKTKQKQQQPKQQYQQNKQNQQSKPPQQLAQYPPQQQQHQQQAKTIKQQHQQQHRTGTQIDTELPKPPSTPPPSLRLGNNNLEQQQHHQEHQVLGQQKQEQQHQGKTKQKQQQQKQQNQQNNQNQQSKPPQQLAQYPQQQQQHQQQAKTLKQQHQQQHLQQRLIPPHQLKQLYQQQHQQIQPIPPQQIEQPLLYNPNIPSPHITRHWQDMRQNWNAQNQHNQQQQQYFPNQYIQNTHVQNTHNLQNIQNKMRELVDEHQYYANILNQGSIQ